jgi:hypothetical protein
MGRACSTHEKRNSYRILMVKLEGKGPVGRLRRRLEDNIKMGLRKIGWGSVDWIHLAQGWRPMEGSCEHGNEPSGFIKYWEILEQFSDWWLLKKASAPWK